MSSHHLSRLLPLALSIALAACATAPAPKAVEPPLTLVPATPTPTASTLIDVAPTVDNDQPEPPDAGNVWDRLRNSFAMPDCDADAAVLAWAHRYTRNPQRFEQEVRAALPKLTYVQQVAAEHDVAGEFVLLPWIESGFRPIPGRRGRPAGMWQIMPATASAMGLRVNSRYDARLDVQSAADAVMKLLNRYHRQFGDWRVAAYAYNAGELSARRMVQKHGNPPVSPVIPHWPVRDVTRKHLTRLLAMACIVREPERFHVTLPTLTPAQHLVTVPLPRSMPLALAANHAGMSLDHLKNLNAAFRDGIADNQVNSYLVMPESHAKQFRTMVLNQPDSALAVLGNGATLTASMPSDATPTVAPAPTPAHATRARTHRVKPGETLWHLARTYSVSVHELSRWNHLGSGPLKPGQVLKVSSPG